MSALSERKEDRYSRVMVRPDMPRRAAKRADTDDLRQYDRLLKELNEVEEEIPSPQKK